MGNIGDFQKDVNGLVGSDFNFAIDRPHGNKPVHVDLTSKFSGGADKVDVDFSGNIIGGSTHIGPTKMNW